jgi:putative ABC transport system permease protein
MFKIYLLVALRKLAKEKLYVTINILSLAIGIGSFLILALYIRSELTFDQHFTNHENIYRISTHFQQGNGEAAEFAVTQEGIGPLLVADYPQLGAHVRFRNSSQNILSYQGVRQSWDDLYLADENVFDVFEHEILAGDPQTAFSDMNSIAVSESFARSYFGDEDPIGKILESDSFFYRVTLMFADLPENTHLKYSALYPYSVLSKFIPDYEDNYIRGLTGVNIYTYLRVDPDFDLASFNGIIESFVEKYMTERLANMRSTFRAELTSLTDIHFGKSLPGDQPNGNIFYLYGFSAVAIFLLLIACINYVNLATARATKRSKEVGMRKVVGASRSQLIIQFLGESLVFTLIALVLGLVFAVSALAFTPIGTLMGKASLISGLLDTNAILGVVTLTLGVTLLAGLYPAFYLSSISPKAALSKATGSWRKGLPIRQLLVLAQMAISIGVISCTLLMSQQMRYLANKPLGFNKENQVWVSLRGADLLEQMAPLKSELLAQSNILNVVDTGQVPGFGNGINMIAMENNEGVVGPEQIDMIGVGLNYVQGLGIEVTRGRAFSEERSVDETKSWMVNETLVRKMGWDEPIGKLIGGGENEGTVIGVTGDFHYAPLNNQIGPLLMRPLILNFENTPAQTRPLQTRDLIVNITGEDVGNTLSLIEEKIRLFDATQVFDPSFLDVRLDELYRSERNLMGLTEIFAGICIFLSAMGLFGLASFNTQQRNKEIGVRKILGASSMQIVVLLCKNVIVLIAVAAIPATILSYLTITTWLQRFAYQAESGMLGTAWPFIMAILAVSFVALLTIVLQSLKTAQSNPIEALRYE